MIPAHLDLLRVLSLAAIVVFGGTRAWGQPSSWVVRPSSQSPACLAGARLSLDDLCRLTPAELEQLYRQSPAAPMLVGKVKGRGLVRPGTSLAVPLSKVSRVAWQGKIFRAEDSTAINRFFGLPIIWGNLYYGPSWLDGGSALILDYDGTSRIYGRNRDELREVAPGLILGLMYDRTRPETGPTTYFALEAR